MKPNIGIVNALIRITCGLTFLGYSTAKLAKRGYRQGTMWLMLMSAMKVAEGITRFCPVTEICKSPAIQEKLQQLK
jgi:hypothetical protein